MYVLERHDDLCCERFGSSDRALSRGKKIDRRARRILTRDKRTWRREMRDVGRRQTEIASPIAASSREISFRRRLLR